MVLFIDRDDPLMAAHPGRTGSEVVHICGLLGGALIRSIGARSRVHPAGHFHCLVPEGLDIPTPKGRYPIRDALQVAEPSSSDWAVGAKRMRSKLKISYQKGTGGW